MTMMLTTNTTTTSAMDMIQFRLFNFTHNGWVQNYTNTCVTVLQAPYMVTFMLWFFIVLSSSECTVAAAQHVINFAL